MPTSTSTTLDQPRTRDVLEAASLLAGLTKPNAPPVRKDVGEQSSKLAGLLESRIESYKARASNWLPVEDEGAEGDGTENTVKLFTARHSLALLCQLARCEDAEKAQQAQKASATASTSRRPNVEPGSAAPVFGMRDAKVVQLLASLVARWGLAALLSPGILPPEMADKAPSSSSQIQEIDEEQDSRRSGLLTSMSRQCLELLTSRSQAGRSELQAMTMPVLLLPTLAALLQIGWAGTHTDSVWAKKGAEKLLDQTPPSTAMAALFTLLASSRANSKAPSHSAKHAWLAPQVSALLSRQLMRPSGVVGLLNVLLGRSENELQINQLEQVAKVLMTPPSDMLPDVYFSAIIPRILALLQPPASGNSAPPPSYIRALSFCISRLIASASAAAVKNVLPAISLDLSSSPQDDDDNTLDNSHDLLSSQLDLLSVMVANIDPSPTNYSFLLHPELVCKLFSLWLFIKETKSDPVLRGAVENLLLVWARSLSNGEVVNGIMLAVAREESEGRYRWRRTGLGGVAARRTRDVVEDENQAQDDEDILAIRPDPDHLIEWLKALNRQTVISGLLVRCLDEIRLLRTGASSASSASPNGLDTLTTSKRTIVRLQLVLKIIEEFGSEIVKEVDQTLVFIDHALDGGDFSKENESQRSPAGKAPKTSRAGPSLSMADLRIVQNDDEEEEAEEQEDHDFEFPELQGIAQGEELTVTALTLLLAILEGHEDLHISSNAHGRSAGTLHSIYLKLERSEAGSASSTVSRLARDAKSVLSLRNAAARTADSSSTGRGADPSVSAALSTYREALKLLQDPILPIRAQGLSLLRSLVASPSSSTLFTTDSALLPGILSIFISSIQEDDSFIYLNAVKGLSTMVDVDKSLGKDAVKRLVSIYESGGDGNSSEGAIYVGAGEKGGRELDKRLRVGEALVQVVQRSDQALAAYVDILLPPLLHIIRTSTLPVALRSSAFTVLATCAEVSPLALLPYQAMLIDTCLDLLSIENAKKAVLAADQTSSSQMLEEDEDGFAKPKRVDESSDPLSTASTHISLRRGALLFISLLLRAQPDDFRKVQSRRLVGRMKNVVGYVRVTDEDGLVRHNAGEVAEDLEAL